MPYARGDRTGQAVPDRCMTAKWGFGDWVIFEDGDGNGQWVKGWIAGTGLTLVLDPLAAGAQLARCPRIRRAVVDPLLRSLSGSP